MRLLYTFRFQQMGETFLAAATGQNAHHFNGVLQLNEVGHFIVAKLAQLPDMQEQDIVNRLTESLTKEYTVDKATAQSAVQQVLDYLKTEQVLA